LISKKVKVLVIISLVFASISTFKTEFLIEEVEADEFNFVSQSWWNDGWNNYRTITINSDYVDEPLTGFPLLVVLDNTSGNYSFMENGEDIRFVNLDNTTEFPYEIEFFNNTGNTYCWVNITETIMSDSDFHFLVYYNNSDASDNQNSDNVWDENYLGVWHLNETTSGWRNDSTSNSNDGTTINFEDNEKRDAIISLGDYFGYDDYINLTSEINLTSTGNSTVSFWMRHDSQDSWSMFFGKYDVDNYFGYDGGATTRIQDDGNNNIDFSTTIPEEEWFYFTLVKNSTNWSIYFNGTLQDTQAVVSSLEIGMLANGYNSESYCVVGIMDEIRIESTKRNNSWINVSFHNQNQTIDFMSLSGEQELVDAFGNREIEEGGGVLINYYTGESTSRQRCVFLNCTNDFKPASSGVADNVTAFLYIGNSGWDAGIDYINASCGIYYADNNSFLARTETKNTTFSGANFANGKWVSFNFTDYVDIVEGSNYTLFVICKNPPSHPDPGNETYIGYVAKQGSSNINSGYHSDYISYENLPDPLNPSVVDNNISIYCNYNTSGIDLFHSYSNHKVITVNSNYIDEDLTNFPLLVVLDNSTGDYNFMGSSGEDIRFSSLDNVTEFYYEIEEFNNSGETYCWVNISEVIENDTDYQFLVYYNNIDAVDGQNPENVWNGNYVGVWHMNDTVGNGNTIYDSSSYNNHGTITDSDDSMKNIPGISGQAINFSGAHSDYISLGNDSSLNSSSFTLEAFYYSCSKPSSSWEIIAAKEVYDNDEGWFNYIEPTTDPDRLMFTRGGVAADSFRLTSNFTWHHSACTYNGTTLSVREDIGSADTDYNTIDLNQDIEMLLGSRHQNGGANGKDGFYGTIDEVRFSNVVRNSTWINVSFHTINQTIGFMTFSSDESYDGYLNQKIIKVESDYIDEDLKDFPLLVVLDNTTGLYDFMSENGEDIRFVSLNNITEFNYEIEEFNNTGLTYCWVNISETIDNDTDYQFIVYYNNPNAVDGQNVEGTWDGNYIGVWHMDDNTTSDIVDSTTHYNNGTKSSANNPIQINGKIGYAQNFSDDDINCGNDNIFDVVNVTTELWFNARSVGDSTTARLVSIDFGNGVNPWHVRRTSDTIVFQHKTGGGGVGSSSIDFDWSGGSEFNEWHYGAWSYTNGDQQAYKNDGLGNSDNDADDLLTSDYYLRIGNSDEGDRDWDGFIDEVRVSNIVRNSSWINTSFHSQNQTTGFMTFYGEMPPNEPPNAPSSLECDNQTNPDHVLDHSPWFDWVFSDPDLDIQDGFHIQVGNDTDWASAEMWDNNESNNGDNFTNYAGLGLNDGDTYYWRVKTKDNNSNWGTWSADQNFRMNSRPTIPSLSAPGNNSEHMPYTIKSINLSWSASTDAEFDSLNYWYQYAKDSGFSDTLVEGWTGGPIYKKIPPAGQLDQDNDYYWRVKTWDGLEWGNYSEWRTFHTDDGLSVFTVYGLSNPNVPTNYGNVTWVGYNDTSTWSNCTEPGGTLELNMTINSTNNITEIRVWLDDLDEIGASNITLYTSSDNSSYGSSGAFLNEGSNISINKSTWNAGTMGSNPFLGVGLTSTNTSVYFRFLLDIPASATNGTHSQSDWKIYIGED